MPRMPTPDRDPGGLFGAIGTAIGAIIALAIAFGVDVTETQTQAILGVIATLGPLVTALAIRVKAWSPDRHFLEVEQAFDRGRQLRDPQDPHR